MLISRYSMQSMAMKRPNLAECISYQKNINVKTREDVS